MFADEDNIDDELAVGEKLKEENYYKYHENVTNYDPKGQPYSYFYISIMGQVEFGEFTGDLDGLQVHYSFVAGEDWGLSDGVAMSSGQYGFKGQGSKLKKIIWNLPFEVTYRTMTPFGWPQIVIYCTSKDTKGEDKVEAYGSIHVPIQPGTHKKTIRMFSPLESNSFYEFFGFFKEGSSSNKGIVHLDAPEIIARADGREVSRVKAGGKVTVSMQITQRNMERHGYITTNNKK
jgi:B9 domain-containing protein 1